MEEYTVNHYFWGSLKITLPNHLNEKYKITKFINDGASASVYLLESFKDQEDIVLKIQEIHKKEWLEEEVFIHKLFNEYNIGPKIYDYWVINNKIHLYGCIILEYLRMGEINYLYDNALNTFTNEYYMLNKNNKFKDQLVKQIRTIHSLGYVHLDIFESNILYRDSENITLCDFGLSCKIDSVPIDRIEKIFDSYSEYPVLYNYIKYKNITLDTLIKNPKLIDYIFVWFVWKIDLDDESML